MKDLTAILIGVGIMVILIFVVLPVGLLYPIERTPEDFVLVDKGIEKNIYNQTVYWIKVYDGDESIWDDALYLTYKTTSQNDWIYDIWLKPIGSKVYIESEYFEG